MSAKLRPDKGTVAENIAKKYFPCTCGETYLSRKLTAPDCPYHAFDWEEAFEEYAASSPKISGEEGQVQGVLACGKSTVDGSYVKGIYRNESGANYIDSIPVHPWSIGVFFEKPPHPQGEQGFAWLQTAITEAENKYNAEKQDADWFNNNTPNVGQFIDYQSYSPLPKWVAEAKAFLERRPLPALPTPDAKEAVWFAEQIAKNKYIRVEYGEGFWCDESEYEWMGEQNRLITTENLYTLYKSTLK